MVDTNVVTIIGRVTKDAEMNPHDKGSPIGFFNIATNRKKKDNSGNYTSEASFFDVNVFGGYADIIIPHLLKGVLVCVTGSLKQERWQDGTGNKKSRVVITASSIQILGGKS